MDCLKCNNEYFETDAIFIYLFMLFYLPHNNRNKNALTATFSLACLEVRSINERAINSTRNRIYLLKVFLLHTLSTSILFICF